MSGSCRIIVGSQTLIPVDIFWIFIISYEEYLDFPELRHGLYHLPDIVPKTGQILRVEQVTWG
jgi:hypothetical protein